MKVIPVKLFLVPTLLLSLQSCVGSGCETPGDQGNFNILGVLVLNTDESFCR